MKVWWWFSVISVGSCRGGSGRRRQPSGGELSAPPIYQGFHSCQAQIISNYKINPIGMISNSQTSYMLFFVYDKRKGRSENQKSHQSTFYVKFFSQISLVAKSIKKLFLVRGYTSEDIISMQRLYLWRGYYYSVAISIEMLQIFWRARNRKRLLLFRNHLWRGYYVLDSISMWRLLLSKGYSHQEFTTLQRLIHAEATIIQRQHLLSGW